MLEKVPLSEFAQINPPRRRYDLSDSDEVSFIPMVDVSDSGRWIERQTSPLREVRQGYTCFEEGDVLFAKITPCMENGKGCLAVGLKNGMGFGSTEFHVLRPKPNADSRFIFHWSVFPQLRQAAEARMIGSAGQQRVPAEFLETYLVPRIDKEQQTKIAEIITTIDQAIEQTEALVAKYERIKTGLMQDLLTRGLDENGNLRDPTTHAFKESPLGKIPAGWEVLPLGRVSQRITSGSRGWAAYYASEGAKFIRIGNLTRRHVNLRWDDVQCVQPPVTSEGKRTALEPGDLLVSVTADLGIIGVVPDEIGEAYINQHIALVKLDRNQVNPWFLGNFLAGNMAQKQFLQLNETGAKAGLNLPTVASILIVCPELNEQDAIALIFKNIDKMISEEEKRRAKLSRLKIGLMQDLLTGKVSVAPLLQEVGIQS